MCMNALISFSNPSSMVFLLFMSSVIAVFCESDYPWKFKRLPTSGLGVKMTLVATITCYAKSFYVKKYGCKIFSWKSPVSYSS